MELSSLASLVAALSPSDFVSTYTFPACDWVAVWKCCQSLMCCNGVRLNCSNAMSHEKGIRLMGALLFLGVCLSVIVIINIERNNTYKARLIEAKYSAHPSRSFNDPTDLSDESLSYGIIFDCGSSGTRIYIYYWPPHSGNSRDLLEIHQVIGANGKPMSKKVTPGLSTYNKNADNAAEYLKPLLEHAANIIPKHKHKATPLYILATAGMRLIPQDEAQNILHDITKDIPEWFDFHFESTHVEIIPGKQEGMYAWISLNYMLGRFSQDFTSYSTESELTMSSPLHSQRASHKKTAGVIDMGGGSLQIAFEVPQPSDIKDKDMRLTFNLGARDDDDLYKYTLYTTTFLGYGANSALSNYKNRLASEASQNGSEVIPDSCHARDYVYTMNYNNKNITIKGTGDIHTCMKMLKPQLNTSVTCSDNPCSINGIHQPSIPTDSMFYGISEFWYSTYDVLALAGLYKHQAVASHAQDFCQTPWSRTMSNYAKNLYPKADMDRMRNECFKVSWIMEALHEGFRFPYDYKNFRPINEIHGQEVQWSLGALVYKTRYLPSKSLIDGISDGPHGTQTLILAPYILVICITVTLGAIALYCRHLQRMKVVPSLKNVPSMSYFMTASNESEQGVVHEKFLYP